MTTDPVRGPAAELIVERFSRPARWFHATVYVTVLILLATGWWLLAGQEGNPSPLSWLTGVPDTTWHTFVGWASGGVFLGGLALVGRSVPSFLAESVAFDRSDLRWFSHWPGAVLSGRFAHQRGRFDPGQRLLNVLLTLGLAILVLSGSGLALLHGGPAFAVLDRIHRIATYPVTALLLGHILVASGVLPGYRGVWRSMHLGGRLRLHVARRLWPAWTESQVPRQSRAPFVPGGWIHAAGNLIRRARWR